MYIISWEPEGHYHYSKMFCWEPEGRCTKSMVTSALLVLNGTSLKSDIDSTLLALNWWYIHLNYTHKNCLNRQLRARRALLQIKDVPLRTRRALSPYTLYSNNALLVLNGTSLNYNNGLLALNWRSQQNVNMIMIFGGCGVGRIVNVLDSLLCHFLCHTLLFHNVMKYP